MHFLSTTFADRGLQPRKHKPTSATTEATLPEKTHGFAPENLFRPEFTRSRHVTLPNYVYNDDVVDIMVRMLPMTIVRNLEVFKLNFL